MRTGVKGDGMCAGGTATANSDPRDGVQNGQQQHHVKECVRGHGSGDVVGIIWSQISVDCSPEPFPLQSVTHSLRTLEARGWIVLGRTLGGRSESLYLTPAGLEKASEIGV